MARRLRDRLTIAYINAATRAKSSKPRMHADGLGLYRQVADSGAASWIYRYKFRTTGPKSRSREMGVGSLDDVTLAEARKKADDLRRKVRDGIDPIEERKGARLSVALAAAKAMTFQQCAEAYIEAHRAGRSNRDHVSQWLGSLNNYVYPVLGEMPAQAIDLALVLKVVEPLWAAKPETASRVRGRIEVVLDWAKNARLS